MVIDTEVAGSHRSKARVEHLEVVKRGDRDAGVADLAVDVRTRIGVAAVERDRVEGGGKALGRHALGDLEEARLVRKASPSPANMRVGSSFSRLKANTPAV
jgi:hypothetical protein